MPASMSLAPTYASVAAGIYATIEEAQTRICKPCARTYHPDGQKAAFYEQKYQSYCNLAAAMDPKKAAPAAR